MNNSGITYHSIKDVCNICFGKKYEGYQKGTCMINDYYVAWFPKIAYVENGEIKPGSKKKEWINEISEDGKFITEYNVNEERNAESKYSKMHILVFAKYKDEEYRFLGIYKTVSLYDEEVQYAKRVYQRIALEADLTMLGKESYELNEEGFIQNVYEEEKFTKTEKKALIKSRIGQSDFRRQLMINHNSKCMICSLGYESLLIASHIKEWSIANSKERLDVENGLLLCTLHDSVFDKHLISFNDNGEIIISDKLSEKDRMLLNICVNQRIEMTEGRIKYMKYHREKFNELNI